MQFKAQKLSVSSQSLWFVFYPPHAYPSHNDMSQKPVYCPLTDQLMSLLTDGLFMESILWLLNNTQHQKGRRRSLHSTEEIESSSVTCLGIRQNSTVPAVPACPWFSYLFIYISNKYITGHTDEFQRGTFWAFSRAFLSLSVRESSRHSTTVTHQKYHSLWMDRALTQQRVPQQSS